MAGDDKRFDDDAGVADLIREVAKQTQAIGRDFTDVAKSWLDKAEYDIDKVVARQIAKHPDAWVEVKRVAKQARRAWQRFERDHLK